MRLIEKVSLTFIIVVSSFCSYSQDLKRTKSMLEQRGEVYIEFIVSKQTNIKYISKIVSIDKVEESYDLLKIKAYLNNKQFKHFENENIKFKLLTPPSMLKAATMCFDIDNLKNWNCYPTYDQYLSIMQSFKTDYPEICKLEEFGQSIEGRKLLVLKISDNVTEKEEEPEFLYTATMHGDETAGYVLMLRFVNYLLTNYGTDDRVTELVNNTEIWINPLSNPDGTYAGGNNTLNGATRGNSNPDIGGNWTEDGRVDLNRNFPDPEEGENPDDNNYQQETIAMMDFMKEHNFVLSANFHGGTEVVNYPWDTWTASQRLHADNNWYEEISREYADTVHNNSLHYMDGFSNGVTHGATWYSISGSRQDYVNYYLHGREVTIELSMVKLLDADQLPSLWNYNYRSLLNYINRVHTGIYGKVTNQFGENVHAKIILENHDVDSSEIYSDANNGMYYRMLSPGSYNIKATAPRHKSETFNLTAMDNSNTLHNIILQKDTTGIESSMSEFQITGYTNPVSNILKIWLDCKQPGLYKLILFDNLGRVITKKNYNVLIGENEFEINIEHINSGIFYSKIKSESYHTQIKFIKLK